MFPHSTALQALFVPPGIVNAVLTATRATVLAASRLHLASQPCPTSSIGAQFLKVTEQHAAYQSHAKVTPMHVSVFWCFLLALQLGTGVTHCAGSYLCTSLKIRKNH